MDGHEFEQAPGVGDEQGSLVCCSPWICKESDRTETELNFPLMDKYKRLMEYSREKLTEWETGSCPDGWGPAQQI